MHIYTHTHTKCTYERTHSTSEIMTQQRLRRKPNLTPRSSALLPVLCSLEGDTLRGQQPNCPSTRNTDKRRTTTTNSSSSHHHDSAPSHQEITRVILCRLIYIIMSFKPFNDIIMIVCKFLIGLCCLRSYST